MPKPSKRNERTVNLADYWDPEVASQSATPQQRLRQQQRLHRLMPARPVADPQALKRAYMLQHFQFVLRADLLSLKSSGGGGSLPQGQRRLLECIRAADSLVPWTAVHSVVMRTTLEEFECPICLDTPTAPRITECGHVFCMSCILQYMSRRKQSDEPRTCPVCHSLIGVYVLRPVVLQLVLPLKAPRTQSDGQVVRFDLFRKERNSCILHRYDDPRITAQGRSPEFYKQQQQQQHDHGIHHKENANGARVSSSVEEEACLPSYGEPCSAQSRYVFSTPAYEANQRYLDGTAISDKLHDIELLERPLSEFDTAEEKYLLEALNEVTKEPEALAPSLMKNSPLIAPRPAGSGSGSGNMKGGAAAASDYPVSSKGAAAGGKCDGDNYNNSGNDHFTTRSRLDGTGTNQRGGGTNSNPVYEVYAEGSGQPYYLHMVSVKMLKHDAKLRNTPLPDTVMGRIIDMVSFTQDEESRRIYKVFAHVPLHGSIQLCLLDLSDTVLPETMAAFKHTLDDMERRRQEQRSADAMSESGGDASWQAYLKRYAAHRFDSPAILPSEVSLETADDSAPFLQLPSAGSNWEEDHGLPPNTLDTRQRATKRQDCGPDSLVPQAATATLASLATLTNQQQQTQGPASASDAPAQSAQGLSTTSSTNSCWGGGSLAKLLKGKDRQSALSSAAVPTWGGHTFSPNIHESQNRAGNHHNQNTDHIALRTAAPTPEVQSVNHLHDNSKKSSGGKQLQQQQQQHKASRGRK